MSPGIRDVTPPSAPTGDGGGRWRVGRWLVAVALVAGVALAVARAGPAEQPPPSDEAAVSVPAADPPPRLVSYDTLAPGQSLGELLRRQGLEGDEFVAVLDRVEDVVSARRLQPGLTLEMATHVPERLGRLKLQLDDDRSLLLEHREDGWESRLDSVPVTLDTMLLAGRIEQGESLWTTELTGDTGKLTKNVRGTIIEFLSNQIYAWQIDFFRGVHPGDAFRVAVEREVRPDGTIRQVRILAAEFLNSGRRLPAVRFPTDDGRVEFYDEEGEATRLAFLRAPLKFGRRTSGFSRRRFHPVLRTYRSHRGVDYGAAPGTPVLATGTGTVTRARRWDGYGKMVEIRHNSVHRTRYAHLRGWGPGIREGVGVSQGQVIGYVGATGLATGPHVHYEFLVNGTQRNPAAVDLPPGDPVSEARRAEFRQVRDERLALLKGVRVPGLPDDRPSTRTAWALGGDSASD